MADPKEESSAQQSREPLADQAAEQTEEWVFTLNSSTGELLKAERVDKTSGQRLELSDDEYAALGVYGDTTAYYAGQGYDPFVAAYGPNELYQAGYYQGLADYDAAVRRQAAYHQGIADYEAMLG